MKVTRETTSFCPTCYRVIPAKIVVQSGQPVTMTKSCPAHGSSSGIVERDPIFYTNVASLGRQSIYPGYFVDVTRRCNLRCSNCYYALEPGTVETPTPEALSIRSLVSDCTSHSLLAPFILTGGEPTLRDDIPDLIKALSNVGQVEMLTNGVRMATDLDYGGRIARLLPSSLHLSIHPETDKGIALAQIMRNNNLRFKSILMVIDSRASFIKALDLAYELREVAQCFRIKAASKVWNEQKPEDHIFVSDMLDWMEVVGYECAPIATGSSKSVYVTVAYRGMTIMLVSWHNVHNVDLADISCPPYYRARNGEIANLVTSFLINEGMSKGWCKGSKL